MVGGCTCLQVGGMGDSRERKCEVIGYRSNQEQVSESMGLSRCKIIDPESKKSLERRRVGMRT